MHEIILDRKDETETILSCHGSGAPEMLSERPAFSWKVYGLKGKQRFYHIIVSSSEENVKSAKGDIWDSGWVESPEDQRIPCFGKTLESNKDYYCAVQIKNMEGVLSPFGKTLKISTGFFEESQWEASWICAPSSGENPLLRREFKLTGTLKRARLFICGLGYYEAYINGKKVGHNLLAPSWTDYTKRVCYVAHDVTKMIASKNALGVMLGNGWYASIYNTPRPAFIAQLILEYEDGRTEKVISAPNSGWTAHVDGPVRKSSIYIGEVYDARKEKDRWAEYGFDIYAKPSGAWLEVLETEPPYGKLVPMVEEPIQAVGEVAAVSLNPLDEDTTIIDFGQNLAGLVKIKLNVPEGTQIKLRFAEIIHKDGTLNTDNLRAAQQTDEYITRGLPEEEYMPRFTYHGFRFAEVKGVRGLKAGDVKAVVLRNAVNPRGRFSCSNDLINRIHNICVWTESNNLHGVPTDCPQRDERLGWLNDLTVRAEEAVYNFDMSRFYRKFLMDITDEQGPRTGAITDVAPYKNFGGQPADAVCSSYLILPWLLYMHHGDRQVLEKHYEGLAAWTNYLKNNSSNGIVNYSYYGDWAAAIGGNIQDSLGNGAVSAITPGKLISTGFLFLNSRMMSRIARILGKEADAQSFDHIAESSRDALNQEFLNKEKAYYGTNSQAANTFMLYLGIVPNEYRAGVVKNLIQDIRAHDTHLTTGNLCSRYIFDVLADNEQIDLAFELATQTTYPSWGYMLANGATTTWERWEYVDSGPLLGMASHDHPMYSTISGWFYSYLLGIRPLEPGFSTFTFKPFIPKALKSAEGVIKSVKGDIEARWEQDSGEVRMAITVPFNSNCRVVLPYKGSVMVNREKREIQNEAGEYFILLEPGSYDIILDNL
ncbi:alpha-L-rhamnosidase [Leadbettera azotonutricia]|uniref:alpha-L-rhamnosidase n=1 Tax=Leadbettera azotonutricia (strain ATCC BAA-888 / DSM 13862 / ZAS-9) TaxID=545695 RepID=F5Y9Y9_LEAAZ|nr:alpha-L-rhamnosidase [Leadbettera azotonutricia]AEF82974.1 alpha-L-rhamnosidase [Leadbettera azotonutricia ZAS-9]